MQKLPPLPKSSGLYLALLAVMALGFYALLIALVAGTALLLVLLALATPRIVMHSPYSIRFLILIYAALGAFGLAVLKAVFVRVGEDPPGMQADLLAHRKLFDLADEVARKVGAPRLNAIYLTPGDDLGVWEEAAIWMPPGMGRRKLVVGIALLNSLTMDQLRCALAHEYAHFSNHDTYLTRFINRIGVTYSEMVTQLQEQGSGLTIALPVCLLLRAYLWIYFRIAAAFSRNAEYRADRCGIEAYGREPYLQALIAAHLEGDYLANAGFEAVLDAVAKRQSVANAYHLIGANRRLWAQQNPEAFRRVWFALFAQKTSAFDSHPSLAERLKAQGVLPIQAAPTPLPRLASTPMLDEMVAPELLPVLKQGEPSAAETLLGQEAFSLQSSFSNLLVARCQYIVRRRRLA